MNYIEKISKMSDEYGDKLIELMDKYNAKSLREITEEQAQEFYEKLIEDRHLTLFSEVVDDESYDVEDIERYIEGQIKEIKSE